MRIYRKDGSVAWENESVASLQDADLSCADLSDADMSWANLSGADLSDADLSDADLSNARLCEAFLGNANLSNANLSNANLAGADIRLADLSGAHLDNANLAGAWLRGATITLEQLRSADMSQTKADMFDKLAHARYEAHGLLSAVREGRINGTCYEGVCACFVGTIARTRGCNYRELQGIVPDPSSHVEALFFAIREGDTPENNPVSAIVAEWIEEFISQIPFSEWLDAFVAKMTPK